MGVSVPLPILTALMLLLVGLCIDRTLRLWWPMLFFYLSLCVGMFFGINEAYYDLRLMRFAALTSGLLCCAPLIYNRKLMKARQWMFETIYRTLSLLVAFSMFIWIFWFVTCGEYVQPYYLNGFRGVFKMGMTLGAAASFVGIIALYRLGQSANRKCLSLNIGLVVASTLCVLASGSRMALVAYSVGALLCLIICRKTISKIWHSCGVKVVAVIAILTFVLFMPKLAHVIVWKTNVAIEHNSLLYSREKIWEERLQEIASSPWFGIGYGRQMESSRHPHDDPTLLEPGSSWLSIAAYGGWISVTAFVMMTVMLLFTSKGSSRSLRKLLIPLSTYFLLYGITEGWLLFVGSLTFPQFWLTASFWLLGRKIATQTIISHPQCL